MLWGSINENSAIVTYLNKFLAENKDDLVLRETGIWLLSDDKNHPCKNLLAIAPRSRRDDRDRGAMAAIAARLCISRRDLD